MAAIDHPHRYRRDIDGLRALAILPVLIGMTIRSRQPELVARYDRLTRRVALCLLLCHILLVLLLNAGNIVSLEFIEGFNGPVIGGGIDVWAG